MQNQSSKPTSRKVKKKLLLAACAGAVALAAVEIALRTWDFVDLPAFDANSQYGFLMAANQSVSPRGHRFQINRLGLRGRDFEVPKPRDVYRVAFLGDSITYGGGSIEDSDLFVNIVAARLQTDLGRSVEAVNISAPGWGVQNIASYVRYEGLYDADLVVWTVPECDFRRARTSLNDYPDFPPDKPPLRVQAMFQVGWSLFVSRWRHSPAPRGTNPSAQLLSQNLETLERFLGEMREQGTPVVVVFVPSVAGYGPAGDINKYRDTVADCHVPALDLGPQLAGKSEDFLDEVHLSSAGHRVVGEAVAGFLQEGGIPN